jgi:hypothetical protein
MTPFRWRVQGELVGLKRRLREDPESVQFAQAIAELGTRIIA